MYKNDLLNNNIVWKIIKLYFSSESSSVIIIKIIIKFGRFLLLGGSILFKRATAVPILYMIYEISNVLQNVNNWNNHFL